MWQCRSMWSRQFKRVTSSTWHKPGGRRGRFQIVHNFFELQGVMKVHSSSKPLTPTACSAQQRARGWGRVIKEIKVHTPSGHQTKPSHAASAISSQHCHAEAKPSEPEQATTQKQPSSGGPTSKPEQPPVNGATSPAPVTAAPKRVLTIAPPPTGGPSKASPAKGAPSVSGDWVIFVFPTGSKE